MGSWAMYNQPQFVQGAQGTQGLQGVQGISGVQGTPVTLTVRVNPEGTLINDWYTGTFLLIPSAQGS